MPEAEQLWAAYLADRSDENRNALALHFMPLANHHADKAARRTPDSVEEGDCIQYAMIGLLQAIERFDPARGVKFPTFCGLRIHGAIVDGIRSTDIRSRNNRTRANGIAEIRDDLRSNGHRGTDDEMREQLGISVSEFLKLWLPYCNPPTQLPFDGQQRIYSSGDEDRITISDIVADTSAGSPIWEAHKRSLLKLVTSGMTKTERVILILYYYEGQTMKEISASVGLTKSRVSQLHTGIVKRLKARLAGREDEFTK